MSAKQIQGLMKEVINAQIKEARAAPGGEEQMQTMAMFMKDVTSSVKYLARGQGYDNFFNPANKVDVIGALNRLSDTLKGQLTPEGKVIELDGNKVGQGVQNATNPRRK